MIQSKSKFKDEVEQEIKFSEPHWSEVRRLEAFTEEEERQNRENKEVFEELKNDFAWCQFFRADEYSTKLGQMIAKGGQAEIYELHESQDVLLKVFERGSLLQLRKLWPLQVLKRQVNQCILGGIMLEDGRFAFVMQKYWGDLRKMIDQAMQAKNIDGIQRPPFLYDWEGVTIMHAEGMIWEVAEKLHEKGIFHRDLKASNILLWYVGNRFTNFVYSTGSVIVADFECSIGVVGTGLWRAPEIMSALEKREVIREEQWDKADVYNYGMTCFEIVTRRLPFEGELENTRASRALVINGHKPKLPSDLDERVKGLITRSWD